MNAKIVRNALLEQIRNKNSWNLKTNENKRNYENEKEKELPVKTPQNKIIVKKELDKLIFNISDDSDYSK